MKTNTKVLLDCLIALTGVLLVTAILGAAEPPRIFSVRNHCSSAPSAVPQQIRVVNRMTVRVRSAEVVEAPPPARAAVVAAPVQESTASSCANGQCSTQQTVASRGRLRLFR